jgi:hypothetical protein
MDDPENTTKSVPPPLSAAADTAPAKKKSGAVMWVGDGTGGLEEVHDRRFDTEEWPIRFSVPIGRQAETWFAYLAAACERANWRSSSHAQLDRAENSGSLALKSNRDASELAIVWVRRRDGPLDIRARPMGDLTLVAAKRFIQQVNEACSEGRTQQKYGRRSLYYFGLPWRGELWLDDTVRLAPPSRQYDDALLGPRVVHADFLLDCIGSHDQAFVLTQAARELAIFLSIATRNLFTLPRGGPAWTFRFSVPDGKMECDLRQIGYVENDNPTEMPRRGGVTQVPLLQDRHQKLIIGQATEIGVRGDIADLWQLCCSLPHDKHEQFFRAGAKWQEALMHQGDRSTLSFALMVVACEALKPDRRRDCNVYDIISALWGTAMADSLKQSIVAPQNVRNVHLHGGEFLGPEIVRAAMLSSYHDPTFDQARRAFAEIVPETLFEWLRRGGKFALAKRHTSRSKRRRRP